MKVKINVYIGLYGSGKDFFAQEQSKLNKNSTIISFAEPLREMVWKLIGYKPKTEQDYIDFKNSSICENHTGRSFLQVLGTDCIRAVDDNFWINATMKNIEKSVNEGIDEIFITDCRFYNELGLFMNIDSDIYDVSYYYTNHKRKMYCHKEYSMLHSSEKMAFELLKMKFAHRENITKHISKLDNNLNI